MFISVFKIIDLKIYLAFFLEKDVKIIITSVHQNVFTVSITPKDRIFNVILIYFKIL